MADINSIVLPDGTEYPISDYYLPVAISNPTNGQVLKYDATNHVWYNGDDAEGSSVFYGTSAPTSQLGANGNLYVKYTEGTGGASDTVDALYVKLDGAWCQISTGGGGGTSDYNDLTNKPQINSVELSGNKSLDDLGIQPSEISKTATGSIVTFSDGGDNIPVESFECEIVAQQESGTPTPANPLLITGFDSADIVASGINIFDEQIETGTLNNSTGETEVDDNKRRSANFIPVKPNTTYSVYNDTGVNLYIYSYGVDKSFIAFDNTGMVTGSTFTTDSNTYYIKFRTQNNPSYDNNISINHPSTDIQYHPYTGALYSIDFGQTIYGGKLIYANGKWFVRETHIILNFSDLDFSASNPGSHIFRGDYSGAHFSNMKFPPNATTPTEDITEHYIAMDWQAISGSDNGKFALNNYITLARFVFIDFNYSTQSDFETARNTDKIVVELVTPIVIPLTSSAKIKTLPGVNNIFSNTGDSTLKYFTNDADGIEELINTSETSAENTTIDDTNLAYEANNAQEAFEKITKSLTWAEYQALSDAEKNNGTAYFITNVNGDGQNFQPVIYSEEEREIGVWKDGKPLYQKTFIKTITCGSEQTLLSAIDLQDVDVIVDIFGDYHYMKLEHYDSSNYRSYVTLAGTTVLGYAKWGTTASVEAKVTIQYTKTTDTPGSGTWTPQGVPAVHYSTDEHVIGTWIDGRTVYEKTMNVGAIGSGTTFAHGITNLDWIIDYSLIGLYGGGNKYISPSNGSSSTVGFVISYWDSTNIIFTKGNLSSNFSNCYCTIRYIKTS